MNGSQQRNSVVRVLLLSLLLIALPAFAAAQKKNAPAPPPPSKPAATAPKPAAKPEAKPEAKPAAERAARPAAKPATAPAAPRMGTTSGPMSRTSTATRAGTATGARPGGTTGARTRGTTPAAKPEVERTYAPPVVVSRPGGGKSVTNAAGLTTNYSPAGRKTSLETKGGIQARFDHSGYIRTIHTPTGMTINHGSHGERRFETRRADGGRIVGFGHGRGFAEHAYFRGGHPYMRRTYFYAGQHFAYAYRGYYWHGHLFYGYVPPYYYAPAYYRWAYAPWAAGVTFGWGWGGAPWYRSYGYYFAPAPIYDSAALWLTDYLLAANLQAAYDARAQANDAAAASDAAAAGGQPTITPEMKQMIADEVRAQIEAERAEAEAPAATPEPDAPVNSAPPPSTTPTTTPTTKTPQGAPEQLPAALDPSLKTFLVSTVLSESTTEGTECSLTPGDILTRIQDTPGENQTLKVVVASSQRNDCAAGTQIVFAVEDLQDMHNDFRAKVSEGLGKLAENQGKNGIPSGPPSASKPNPNGQVQPDMTVEADLRAQQAEVSQAESDIQQASVVTPASD